MNKFFLFSLLILFPFQVFAERTNFNQCVINKAEQKCEGLPGQVYYGCIDHYKGSEEMIKQCMAELNCDGLSWKEISMYGCPEGGSLADKNYRSERNRRFPPEEETEASEPSRSTNACTEIENIKRDFKDAKSEYKACLDAQETTAKCCGSPQQCLFGNESLGDAASIAQILGVTATRFQQARGSISGACNLMKSLGAGGAALNIAAAESCNSKINQCVNACQGIHDQMVGLLEDAEVEANECLRQSHEDLGLSASHYLRRNYPDFYRDIRRATQETDLHACETYKNEVNALRAQGVSSGVSSLLATRCEEASTTTSETGFDEVDNPTFTGDCSNPANFNLDICIECRKPNSHLKPQCQGIVGIGGPSGDGIGGQDPNGTNTTAFRESDGRNLDTPPDTSDNDLGPLGAPGGAGGSSGLAQPSGGQGGGGVPGGGGGAAALGSTEGGGPASDSGPNTDILKGEKGGGGYTTSAGGFRSSGGFKGYSGGRRPDVLDSDRFKKFDLSKYVNPEGPRHNDPKRGLSGLSGNLDSEIAGKHENIFQKVHNRYRVLCKLGRLYGCNGDEPPKNSDDSLD